MYSTNLHRHQCQCCTWVGISHALVHSGPQGVALLLDNIGQLKLETYKLGDNASIFTIQNPNPLTFPYNMTARIANSLQK